MLRSLRQNPLLHISGWITLPLFPLFCLFVMDYMNFQGNLTSLHSFWEKHPESAAFEILVVLLLFSILTLLLRRVWLSAGIFGTLSFICAYVNYTKAALNGDHFFPQDIAMVSQAGELTSFLSGTLPDLFLSCMGILILWTVCFLFIGLALPRPFFVRWSAAILLILMAYSNTCTPDKTNQLLTRFGMSAHDSALQSSNYQSNGFVGAFTINVLSMHIRPPQGYSETAVTQLLAPYKAVPANPAAEQFDVVVVLSESFFDARTLPGVSFSENPLTNYDRLLADKTCFSGKIYTTAIGGGTVRPEFSILTGLTTDYMANTTTPYWHVTHTFPSYVSAYKDVGYHTIALHPYNIKFYSRNTAYPIMGFDEFYSEVDMYNLTSVVGKRGYVADSSTAEVMMDLMDAQQVPTFLFTITMENHQPYNALPEEDIRIKVECDTLSESAHTALTTYTQGLYDADQMLGTLVEWIDQRERPTVLVFFGDHLPTLGSNHLAYNETGFFNSYDGFDRQELQKLYSTPFLIYSNRTLDDGLVHKGTDNHISDYNLLNSVLRSTGMPRSPYHELLADCFQSTPYYNIRLLLSPTEENQFLVHAMELITYDRVLGKGWSS